ncbi:hypothetical protein BpHYR1_041314 [Brachionus plicatilis]|uniref:Uncharacterized protein n=1 Tax=Brachionus plicatilis TaxID=10195 RepID=A0A3M7P7W8_BRAPC|nr:hypothetical protein BpHYR1_041314 [Brachionus plicatilis]
MSRCANKSRQQCATQSITTKHRLSGSKQFRDKIKCLNDSDGVPHKDGGKIAKFLNNQFGNVFITRLLSTIAAQRNLLTFQHPQIYRSLEPNEITRHGPYSPSCRQELCQCLSRGHGIGMKKSVVTSLLEAVDRISTGIDNGVSCLTSVPHLRQSLRPSLSLLSQNQVDQEWLLSQINQSGQRLLVR